MRNNTKRKTEKEKGKKTLHERRKELEKEERGTREFTSEQKKKK